MKRQNDLLSCPVVRLSDLLFFAGWNWLAFSNRHHSIPLKAFVYHLAHLQCAKKGNIQRIHINRHAL
jgi:hypothetical protein